MSVRKEIEALLDTENPSPSLSYWNTLLEAFRSNNKNDFDVETMRILCDESERCRLYWNTPRKVIKSYIKGAADEPTYQEVEEHSLEIAKGDVNPRIYDWLSELELRERIKQVEENQRRREPIALNRQLVPVAA